MKEYKDLKPLEQRKQPTFTYPDGTKISGELIDEIYVDSPDIDENTKGIVYKNMVQKIRLEDKKETIRFCYYWINLDDDEPKWMYSRQALVVTEEQFTELLNKMLEKGWIHPTINF